MSKVKLLPHNQLTFEYILELSKNNKKICIPQATGTGKTWLEARILEEWSDKKAMIFAPRNEILDETCATLEDNKITNAETITYQTFNNMSDEDIINMEVDIILFDEAHRILATEWYKKIQILIDSHPNSMVFGLTATPVRPDGRDIREEVFENCSTHYITLGEAIVRDIVKMPIYVSALYTFDNVAEELQNKIKKSKNSKEEKLELKKRLKSAKKNLELSMGVPTIIKKYITDYNGKYLVFCRDTKHLEESMSLVNKWFREAKYDGNIINYRIGSNYSDSYDQLEAFKNDNGNGLKLLFSIEKLNEGVHIPTVDGVILLRPTNSNIVYYQQIGRCIRANSEKKPVILDLVNNTNGIKIPLRDDIKKCIKIRRNGGYTECSNEFKIKNYSIVDYLHKTASVFNEIENDLINLHYIPYTLEEEKIIKENYKYGKEFIMKLLPDRTWEGIRKKAKELGVIGKVNYWTKEEDEELTRLYLEYGARAFNMMKNRSYRVCATRRLQLGLVYTKGVNSKTIFSYEEDEIIKDKYPEMGYHCYIYLDNKTPKQVKQRAKVLNVKRNKNPRTSKYKYVSYDKGMKKYMVAFVINGKRIKFGYYDNEDEAGKVAMEKAKEYGKAI